jgi:arsenate-mycothiol transferase
MAEIGIDLTHEFPKKLPPTPSKPPTSSSPWAAGTRARCSPAIATWTGSTAPGPGLNALSVQVLDEVGVDITGEAPKAIDPELLRSVDLMITLGRDAHLEVSDGVAVRNRDTDEPSERGIERMRLVRDDITKHVDALAGELRTGAL